MYNLVTMWKRLPYWVRGGLVSLFACGFFLISERIQCAGDAHSVGCFIFSVPSLPLLPLIPITQKFSNQTLNIIFLVGPLILWFLLGSLIGLIVGKFKKKSLPPTSQI